MATPKGHLYNEPEKVPSTIGPQMNNYKWDRASLVDAQKEVVFTALASVKNLPKHFGKTIKVYHYMPLLDDRNVNDQGIDAKGAQIDNGNLYGSSRDIGTITSKLPALSETGGRVNRVGFKRIVVEGSIHKMGFFYEFSQEMLDFDSDEQAHMHMRREAVRGAVQAYEAQLQIDLLNAAGTVLYGGEATKMEELNAKSAVTYKDLLSLHLALNDARCPTQTSYIFGSRNVDTRVISNGRYMHVSSDLLPHLMGMKNLVDEPAWIGAEAYGDAGSLANFEVGSIGPFRLVTPPEMLHYAGKGADAAEDATKYHTTGGKFDVFPMLVVGSDSFSTIGFQYNGKNGKFQIISKMPGLETADRNDPYGEMGFTSIKWYYGFLAQRAERLGLILTVAPL